MGWHHNIAKSMLTIITILLSTQSVIAPESGCCHNSIVAMLGSRYYFYANFKGRFRVPEWLSDLPKVTQLANSKTGIPQTPLIDSWPQLTLYTQLVHTGKSCPARKVRAPEPGTQGRKLVRHRIFYPVIVFKTCQDLVLWHIEYLKLKKSEKMTEAVRLLWPSHLALLS